MKPLALSATAFGPYGGTETLDFESLSELGLFVVSGPTGAGKTSIFDAMCLALYGGLPGNRAQHTDVRSAHAGPRDVCEVSLDFEASEQRWRVWRRPTQTLQKVRGEGFTERQGDASIHRWDGGDWEPVISGSRDVNAFCEELVGLSLEQFQRVVLLPQGKFAEVLNAKSNDRADLLRTLFGSEVFSRTQEILKAQTRTLEQQVGAAAAHDDALLTAARAAVVRALRHAPGSVPEPALARSNEDDLDLDQLAPVDLRAHVDHLSQELLPVLSTSLQRARNAAETAVRSAERAVLQAGVLDQRALVSARDASMAEVASDWADEAIRLERAHAAARIAPIQQRRSTSSEAARRLERNALVAAEEANLISAAIEDQTSKRTFDAVSLRGVLPFDTSCLPGPERIDEAVQLVAGWGEAARRASSAMRMAEEQQRRAAASTLEVSAADERLEALAARDAERAQRREAAKAHQADLITVVAERSQRTAALELAAERCQLHGRRSDVERERVALVAEERQLASQLDDVENKRAEVERESRAQADIAAQHPLRQAELERCETAVARREELIELEIAAAEAHTAADAARIAADDALHAFISGSAPRLAEGLEPGQPCMVCGSPDHPMPANASPEASGHLFDPDRFRLDGSTDVVDVAFVEEQQAAATNAARRLVDLAARTKALLKDAPELATTELGVLEQRRKDADAAHRAALDAATRGADLAESLTRIASEQERLEGQRLVLQERVRDLRSQEQTLTGALGSFAAIERSELEAQRAAAQGHVADVDAAERTLVELRTELERIDHQSLADEKQQLDLVAARSAGANAEVAARTEAERLGKEVRHLVGDADPREIENQIELLTPLLHGMAGAARRVAEEARSEADATEQLEVTLAESSFESVEEALAAWIDTGELHQRSERLDAWNTERAAVSAQLEALNGQDLPEQRPDVERLQLDAAAASQAVEAAERVVAELAESLDSAERALSTLESREVEHAETRSHLETLRQVSKAVSGDNHRRLSLENWVLAAYLREVVEHANLHLSAMSSGRYQLSVRDEAANRRGRHGLDLAVEDSFTGTARSTVSLSGGETFQASLSLALGLADVVVAGRAGLRLDALFVDEGFGSLDAAAIDHAVSVLDGLRTRGSMVGVITHVEAMKHALPVAVEVLPNSDGSGSSIHQRL